VDAMDYSLLSKEELISNLEEKQLLVSQLLLEKEQETRLNYAWAGNLGAWYWNVKTDTVTFNPLKATTLGYSLDELPKEIGFSFFTEKLHPDDYQRVMQSMIDHLKGKISVYEVEYRIQAKDGSYKWYYDRGKITRYEDSGKPLFLAGIVFDITEKKTLQEDLEISNQLLEKLSRTDGLTNLLNHRALFEQLDVEREKALALGTPLAIAILDLDNFKAVNDTYGHLAGDGVLSTVARILLENTRDCDFVGRYGGDEFLVILTNTDKKVACALFERVLSMVRQVSLGKNSYVTMSIGLGEYQGERLTDFVAKADKNLYKAKVLGKNQIVCFG
jgi:diguanylate cyclase (GGDEF)-like protein/PAS domain S-box-containing protein